MDQYQLPAGAAVHMLPEQIIITPTVLVNVTQVLGTTIQQQNHIIIILPPELTGTPEFYLMHNN
jgi:uncharacterized protein (DUF4213/DUF364 family)